MLGIVCICLVCILSIYIVATFFTYSQSGDLNNSIGGLDKVYKTEDKDEIIKQLYEIVVLNKSQVRWPFLIALSIVFTIFITYATKSIDTQLQRFVIILPLIFIPLYVFFNYTQAHGGNKSLISAAQLFALNKAKTNSLDPLTQRLLKKSL
jgi:hypothetical protein